MIPDDPEKTSIEPGFLSVLPLDVLPPNVLPLNLLPDTATAGNDTLKPDSSGRRTALARWIGRPDNPLTTRVIVNRVWQQHFGEGLVPTPSNFGHTGEAPTHPELLDWLTATFIEGGWRIKKLHKLILMSATWRQSAHHPRATEYQAGDPAERLLWRTRIRRLKAEQIRDALLSVSGELEVRVGGPSVDEKTPRRALYVKRFRNNTETFLHAFDAAAGLKSVDSRNTTTTPTQSLLLLNGDYALGRARKFAARLSAGAFAEPTDLLRHAVLRTWGREPTPAELASALRFVTSSSVVSSGKSSAASSGVSSAVSQGADPTSIDADKLVDFCHILFNSNEFLYVR